MREVQAQIARDADEDWGECPICFESMARDRQQHPPSVMLDQHGTRVCEHLLCGNCLLKQGAQTCPICRKPYFGIAPLPSLFTEPDAWFKMVDLDGNGSISQKELVAALKVVVPVNHEYLERKIAQVWCTWDRDGSGELDSREIGAVAAFVSRALYGGVAGVADALPQNGPMPDPLRQPEAWFTFWDTDNSGELDREECVRAIMHTMEHYGVLTDRWESAQTMRSTFDIFDTDGSGSIDRGEAAARGGLFEAVADTIRQMQGPREHR